jgi:hypothetical protein
VPREEPQRVTPPSASAARPASGLETLQIGRQAIYDASLHSRAYELFYRDSARGRPELDGDRAACSVVLSAFVELGLARVASHKRVLLNVSHDVISGALPPPVPTDVVVLQVRDYEHSVSELQSALEQRRSDGFQVALDGLLLSHERLPKSLETVTLLLQRLRDPAIEFSELERVVKTDPALCRACSPSCRCRARSTRRCWSARARSARSWWTCSVARKRKTKARPAPASRSGW